MKTNLFKIVSTGMVFCIMLISSACRNEEEFLNNAPEPEAVRSAKLGIPTKFDQVKFAELIEEYLEPQVAGFGYALYNDGVEYYRTNGGDGWARKPFDVPLQGHSAIVRQETMQVTQYVSALAVIRVLEKYGVPMSAKVHEYMPAHWNPSSKFKQLSFERLLAHKTGLINYNNGLLSLRKTVEGPVQETEFSQLIRDDDHVNYDLLALALPYVIAKKLSQQGNPAMLNDLNNRETDWELFKITAMHFREFVRFNVFIPAGLSDPSLIAWKAWDSSGDLDASKSTKGYPSPTGDQPGIPKADNTMSPGATGLYISASQFAKIQSAVAQFKIVSLNGTMAMKQGLLGYDGKLNGSKGSYYWKKGDGNNCETMIFNFGKVQLAVFTNSPQSEISKPQVLANFFEDSWVPL